MSKIRSIVLFVLMLGYCSVSSGQKQVTSAPSSLLWELKHPNIPHTSYLFGTIHIICDEYFVWTPTMQAKFDQCTQLGLEMDITDTTLLLKAAQWMTNTDGSTLESQFASKDDYNIVYNYIKDSLQQDPRIIRNMKLISLYLYLSNSLANTLCENTLSYEMTLIGMAMPKKMKITGLESIEDQYKALEALPKDSVISQILQVCKGESNEWDKELENLMQTYNKQDLDAISNILDAQFEKDLNSDLLLDQRNSNWVAPIISNTKKAPTFFAVGAGHLKGLIALLTKEGYTLSPVR